MMDEPIIEVSILTRPSGRMQPSGSSSSATRWTGFNPHPAFWPDATSVHVYINPGIRVSILTRPSGRMQLAIAVVIIVRQDAVSILTRPSGRMQRGAVNFRLRVRHSFNPHPAFWPDARQGVVLDRTPYQFQSSPGLLAGCNFLSYRLNVPSADVSILTRPSGRMQRQGGVDAAARSLVSILTRPSGRMQRRPPCRRRRPRSGFNPHPAFWPDATVTFIDRTDGVTVFQSSPGLLAGCNPNPSNRVPTISSFQSSPGLLAGCNGPTTG